MADFNQNDQDAKQKALIALMGNSMFGQPTDDSRPTPLMPPGMVPPTIPDVPPSPAAASPRTPASVPPPSPVQSSSPADMSIGAPDTSQTKPDVRKYLMDKYFGADLNSDAMKAAQDRADEKTHSGGLAALQFLSGLGGAISGRGGKETSDNFAKIRSDIQNQEVGKVEQGRKNVLQDLQAQGMFQDAEQKQQVNDPTSKQSQLVQGMVSKLYPGKFTPEQLSSLTASNADSIYKPLELDAKIKEAAATAQLRNQMLKQTQDEKKAKDSDKAYTDLNDKLLKPRGNQSVQQAMLGQAATSKMKELMALYPNLDDMPQDQVNTFRMELAKAAGGGVATEGMMKELSTPSTWSHIKNMISMRENKPLGADLGAFLKNNKNYVEGLDKTNNGIVNKYTKDAFNGSKNRLSPEQQQRFQEEHPEAFGQDSGGGSFPRQLRKDGHVATVNSAQELKEAQSEGWQ